MEVIFNVMWLTKILTTYLSSWYMIGYSYKDSSVEKKIWLLWLFEIKMTLKISALAMISLRKTP